jgi:hypothetical protein
VSDWARVLKECGVADVSLVGVHLPAVKPSMPAPQLELVRRGHEHFAVGHYTAAVAECRRAIESLWKAAQLTDLARAARQRLVNMNGQLSMTKRDRELVLGEALRIFGPLGTRCGAGGLRADGRCPVGVHRRRINIVARNL